jgi:hypothetical protein
VFAAEHEIPPHVEKEVGQPSDASQYQKLAQLSCEHHREVQRVVNASRFGAMFVASFGVVAPALIQALC